MIVSASSGSAAPLAFPASSAASTDGGSATAASDSASGSSSGSDYYSSPIFTHDAITGVLVEQTRSHSTGEVESQSPSRAALLYGQTQGLAEPGSASSSSSSSSASAASSAQAAVATLLGA